MREVHVIVPDGIDDPARPSGGNTYDRQVCQGLAAIGNSRFVATPQSQEAIEAAPGADGMGSVYSGWLEASNVDIATEMTGLVIAKRGYQLNMVAYKTIEEMLSKVNQVA